MMYGVFVLLILANGHAGLQQVPVRFTDLDQCEAVVERLESRPLAVGVVDRRAVCIRVPVGEGI